MTHVGTDGEEWRTGARVVDDAERFEFIAALPAPSARGRVLRTELGIRIDHDGLWYYHGSPIVRKELVCLFASALQRDKTGNYWLVTPGEVGLIEVDDAPLQAVEMYVAGHGAAQVLSFRTNVDEIVTADAEHRLSVVTRGADAEPAPYLNLDGGIEARLTRSVYYDLVGRGIERTVGGRTILGVWSSAVWFPLGDVDPDTE